MRRLVPVLVAITSLALAGTASTAVAATTKAEFIKRGDTLCARMATELAPLRRRAEAAKSLPQDKQWAAATAIWSDQIRIQVRFNQAPRDRRAVQRRNRAQPPGSARPRRRPRPSNPRRLRGRAHRHARLSAPGLHPVHARAQPAGQGAYGFRVCGRS